MDSSPSEWAGGCQPGSSVLPTAAGRQGRLEDKVTGAGSDRGLLSHRDWIFLEGFSTASGTQVDWTLDRQIPPPPVGQGWMCSGPGVRWDLWGSRGQGHAAVRSLRLAVPGMGQEVVCGEGDQAEAVRCGSARGFCSGNLTHLGKHQAPPSPGGSQCNYSVTPTQRLNRPQEPEAAALVSGLAVGWLGGGVWKGESMQPGARLSSRRKQAVCSACGAGAAPPEALLGAPAWF